MTKTKSATFEDVMANRSTRLNPSQLGHVMSGDGWNLSSKVSHCEGEEGAVAVQKRRIAARQKIGNGWDGAANDNKDWPLAKALKAEKNEELLAYAVRYRQIEASANSGAELGGGSIAAGELPLDGQSFVRADGEIAYVGTRKSRGKGINPDDIKSEGKPWTGDNPVNAAIDDGYLLMRLQGALGPLVEPFEMACIEGATLEAVGRSLGQKSKQPATSAARSLIHLALGAIRRELGDMRPMDMAA